MLLLVAIVPLLVRAEHERQLVHPQEVLSDFRVEAGSGSPFAWPYLRLGRHRIAPQQGHEEPIQFVLLPLLRILVDHLHILLHVRAASQRDRNLLVIALELDRGLARLANSLHELALGACRDLLPVLSHEISRSNNRLPARITKNTALPHRHGPVAVDGVDVCKADPGVQRQSAMDYRDVLSDDVAKWKHFEALFAQVVYSLGFLTEGPDAVRVDKAIIGLQVLLLVLVVAPIEEDAIRALDLETVDGK
mmetsp:Transcript_65081/g.153144  ORF Transcript_65081/g.153144 Transcript_65081/m.153144 type:complete len:249 (+) Transcript_65081:1327-2073(+)